MVIVYILLFILCLSILIMVHEAGHLATAKIFKVYCFEYAIGFGPKLFSKKRKNGETNFSIRAIPFGGFVSMYGESETVPEGIEVDPSRSLLAIKKWKRAIIMFAGVFMNFILALVIFFIYEIGFPRYIGHYGHVEINGGLASYAGLNSGDSVYTPVVFGDNYSFIFYDDQAEVTFTDDSKAKAYVGYIYETLTIKDTTLNNHIVVYPREEIGQINTTVSPIHLDEIAANDYSDDTVELRKFKGFYRGIFDRKHDYEQKISTYGIVLSENAVDPLEASHLLLVYIDVKFEDNFNFIYYVPRYSEFTIVGDMTSRVVNGVTYKYLMGQEYDIPYFNVANNILAHREDKKVPKNLSFSLYVMNSYNPNGRGTQKNLEYLNHDPIRLIRNDTTYKVDADLGISMQIEESRNSFGKSIKETFVDFGESSIAIYRGLAHLFTTRDGWKDVGGIIAIGVSTTRTLQQNGFGAYLYIWGLISVNLGIINLLPFPGLDGWHLLVLAVEGIFRKEIPAKVKNIISAVGILLLFGLMFLIIIKDVIGLF